MHSWTIIHHFLEWDSSPIARISQPQSLARSPGNSRSTWSDERQYGQWLRADHCGWRDTLWPQNWQSKVSLIMMNIGKAEYTRVWNCIQKQRMWKIFHILCFCNGIKLFFCDWECSTIWSNSDFFTIWRDHFLRPIHGGTVRVKILTQSSEPSVWKIDLIQSIRQISKIWW